MKETRFDIEHNKANLVEFLRPSPIFAFFSAFPLLILSLIALLVAITVFSFFIILALLMVLIAFYRYIYITKTRYVITTETIIIRTGVVARKFDNLELFRVKDFVVSQSIFERIFGLMTVTVYTTDLTTANFKMQGIPRSNIAETIRVLVHTARLNSRIFEIT